MRSSTRTLCLALVVTLAWAAGASAAAISGSMQEPFEYAGDTLFPNTSTLNGGQGWNATGTLAANAAVSNWGSVLNGGDAAGTFRTATTPGLTHSAAGYLNGTGSKLTLDAATPNATQNIGRQLGGQVIDAGTTYFSLLMSKNTDTIRTINMSFHGPDNAERFAIGQIGTAAGNTDGNIALLMNNSNPAGLVQAASPIAMGVGVTHLILGRIDWNAAGFETVTLWVDPADVTTEAAAGAPYASTSAFELTSIAAVRPFTGNTAGAFNAVSANFDEIRLGGTWASVATARVPEPASIALAAILGMALLPLRRRASR